MIIIIFFGLLLSRVSGLLFVEFQALPQSSGSSASVGDNTTLTTTQMPSSIGAGSGSGLKNTLGVPGVSKSRPASGNCLIWLDKIKQSLEITFHGSGKHTFGHKHCLL